jgi:predicted TIM-barrel fold metal-dependent hydrolase
MTDIENSDRTPRRFDVVDAHTHLAWQECAPLAFIDASVDNMYEALLARGIRTPRTAIRDRMLGSMQDQWGDAFIAELDVAGVSRAAVMVPDFSFIARSTLTVEELLLHHRRVAERHPDRLVLFAGVDPRWGKDGLDLFERAVGQWGFRGLKLYPPCGYSPSDPSLFPFYEICRAHGLPVLLHIGPTSPCLAFDTAHPRLLDRACREFPTVKFILGHGGAHHVAECVDMAAFRPNVYIDSSGMQVGSSVTQVVRDLDRLFAKGISHKILYATDWPVVRTPMVDLIGAMFEDSEAFEQVSERELALVASGNFDRLWESAVANAESVDLQGRGTPMNSRERAGAQAVSGSQEQRGTLNRRVGRATVD